MFGRFNKNFQSHSATNTWFIHPSSAALVRFAYNKFDFRLTWHEIGKYVSWNAVNMGVKWVNRLCGCLMTLLFHWHYFLVFNTFLWISTEDHWLFSGHPLLFFHILSCLEPFLSIWWCIFADSVYVLDGCLLFLKDVSSIQQEIQVKKNLWPGLKSVTISNKNFHIIGNKTFKLIKIMIKGV